MFRIYFSQPISDAQNILIKDKETVKKITKVLRLSVGQSLVVFDNAGNEVEVVIKEIKSGSVICRLSRRIDEERELPVEINLYQALLKKDKLEYLAQKVTEIGVKSITPVIAEFCVVRELNENKMGRYKKIIQEATTQCGGRRVLLFNPAVSFEQAVRSLNPRQRNLICCEPGIGEECNSLVGELNRNSKEVINIFIGPEGGFSSFEIDLARQNGLIPVSLGKRILRAETAAIVACAVTSQCR